MDAVQQANSGHPGMPMGMADIAEVLWNDFLKHNPGNPDWWDRDRFVVSNGHGSMLLYSLLHLSGYELPMDELINFRQLHSMTPGHPEFGETPGVETTTGPLGQGLANAVGMALAEQVLARRFNQSGHTIVDHHTYVFLGDGCLMEGISHEVCSLAGTLGLGKLIGFYDDNNISIDGEVGGWFSDDTPARFRAYGWQVLEDVDGHDADAIHQAIESARAETQRPTLICCKTVIGFGSPNKGGTAATHGAPLGEDEIAAVRETLDWSHAPFEIPDPVYRGWDARQRGARSEAEWDESWADYQQALPELAAEFQRRMDGELPDDWDAMADQALADQQAAAASVASRKASQMALEAFGPHLPELIGGSADLAGSNNTIWSGSEDVLEGGRNGNYIYFGVREFGMTAIGNGLALHGGFIPYVATFLVFSDYARNAVRMSALMPTQTLHVYTHDSIGLGEDGPTHQPVEHLASLRMMPNMEVWRPADAVESLAAWRCALERRDGPSCLIFSRQGLPHQPREADALRRIQRGGYVLTDTDDAPRAVIIATGSELGIAMEAAASLQQSGVPVRVVSMPCAERFAQQSRDYRESVLPPDMPHRLAVEAGVSHYWRPWVGDHGRVIGIDRFGASAPGNELMQTFGFTAEHIARSVREMLGQD